jgi:dTDP-4-dehydrorhamnose reductase
MSAHGSASWFEFARAILGAVDRPRLVPIATAEYPTLARRPAYAVLATRKLEESFGVVLPEWRESLARCLAGPA